jgi:chromosome segregation ATPase
MSGHEIELTALHTKPVPVPLPTEIPPPPDLSHLPSHILHSGSVETLIGQNEDLFARLKVNIRRNSVLEGEIMDHERANGELLRANQSLLSQLQVLQEKDQLWRDKTFRAETSQGSLREELDLYKTRITQAEARITELVPLVRYQARVRRWLRPFIDKLTAQLKAERKTLLSKEAIISDLRARLSEATQYAQSLEAQGSRDQARLVEQYESQQKIMTSELEKVKNESKLWRDKASRLDQAVAADAASQNQIVYLERQNKDLKAHAESHRRETLQFAQSTRKHEEDMAVLRIETDELKLQLAKTKDQLESLQTVWMETQKRHESLKIQHEGLNRLNQELSRSLKEKRTKEPAGEEAIEGVALAVADETRSPGVDC